MSEQDRRQGDRIPINQEFAQSASTWVSDLSAGGVFVHGAELLPVGSTVELRFTVLLDDPIVIEAVGKIVRHSRRPPGIGVQFTSIDDATRGHIEDVLARHKPIDSGEPLRLPEIPAGAQSSGSGVSWARPAPIGGLSLTCSAPTEIEDDVTHSFARLDAEALDATTEYAKPDPGKDFKEDGPTLVFRPPPPPSTGKSSKPTSDDDDDRTQQFSKP